ncbi:MAG: cytochrome c oxidase assembly protein [Phycisphaerales bacterium]
MNEVHNTLVVEGVAKASWSELIRPLWNVSSPAWFVAAAWLATWWALNRNAERGAAASGATAERHAGRRAACALAAAAAFVLSFVSPLGALASGALFSAHMVQHLSMLLVVPLLALAALPRERAGGRFARSPWRGIGAILGIAPLGWALGLGAMWVWHEPTACSAATRSAALGAVRDATFLLAGTAFWWPIAGPVARDRLEPPLALAYLFSACLGCTVLGILITFTPLAVGPVFADNASGALAELPLVARLRGLGFTPRADQQLGGLLMWVPPCVLYAAMSMRLMARWYGEHRRSPEGAAGLPAAGASAMVVATTATETTP